MSFADVAEALRDRFSTLVATPNSLVVVHDNAPPQALKESWYRFRVEFSGSVIAATGGPTRRFRTTGVARVELYAPLTKGDGSILGVADDIVTAFRHVVLASPDIHIQTPRLVGPAVRSDAWFQRVVEIPFWFDEVS